MINRFVVLLLLIVTMTACGVDAAPYTTIQMRRDTPSNWATFNPVLAAGETGCEMTGTPLRCTAQKVGDGVTRWGDLPYQYRGFGEIDATQYTTLAEADATAVAAGKQLVISTVWNTVPATLNAAVKILPGGGLNNSGPLAINGPFEAGLYQVFGGSGAVSGLSDPYPDYFQTNIQGTTDMTAAITAANAAAVIGGTLHFEGLYKVTGSGAHCLAQTRNVDWIGSTQRGATLRFDIAGGNTTTDGLYLAVTSNGGMGSVYNQRIENLTMFLNGGGRDVIRGTDIGTGILPHFQFTIRNCSFTASSGYDVHLYDGFAFSIFEHNVFGSGVYLDRSQAGSSYGCADGQRVLFNQFIGQGANPGLVMDMQLGTLSHTVQSNSFSNKNGAVYIINGSQIKILYNQMEQYGANTGTFHSMVTVLGIGYPSESIDIIGNNFGGGSSVDYNLYVLRSYAMIIRDNDFSAPAINDIVFDDTTGKHNRIGYNRSRGTAVPVITDTAYGTFGSNKLSSNVTLSNGWTDSIATFRFVKNDDNYVRFRGKLTGGALTNGTLVFTLPAGFRPSTDSRISVPTATSVAVLAISAATGQVTIASYACPDATLYLENLTFYAEPPTYP